MLADARARALRHGGRHHAAPPAGPRDAGQGAGRPRRRQGAGAAAGGGRGAGARGAAHHPAGLRDAISLGIALFIPAVREALWRAIRRRVQVRSATFGGTRRPSRRAGDRPRPERIRRAPGRASRRDSPGGRREAPRRRLFASAHARRTPERNRRATMADTSNNGGQAAPGAAQPQQQPGIHVLGQYIKDLSFENPSAPRSLRAERQGADARRKRERQRAAAVADRFRDRAEARRARRRAAKRRCSSSR